MASDQKIQLTVQVNTDTGQLEVLGAKFDQASQKAKGAGDSFSGLTGEAGNLLKSLLPIATIGGLVAFFASAVKGAEEQNEAFRRLKTSVEGMGISWEKNREAIEKWTIAIANSTRFSDSDAINSLEKLTRITGSLSQAQTASQLAMGLSVSSGKNLAETTALVTDLLNGNQRALIEVKREFGNVAGGATDTQQALSALQKAYGDAALTSKGLTDSSSHLANSFTQLKDSIGNALIPVLIPVMDVLRRMIDGFQLLGIVIGGLVRSNIAMLKADFAGMKKAFDETIDSVQEFEQKRTSSLAVGEQQRLTITKAARDKAAMEEEAARREELQKEQEKTEKIAALEQELNQKIAGLKQFSLQQKLNALNAEVAAEQAKIQKVSRSKIEAEKFNDKLNEYHKKQALQLANEELVIKQQLSFEIANTAVQTLQTLNSLGSKGSDAERTRAKALLALQQAIAIGWAWVAATKAAAETGNPALAYGLAAAQTAAIVAQFASGVQQIDRAANTEASGIQGLNINAPVPGIDLGAGGGGSGGLGGGGGVVAISGGGGGGGGGGTVINVGGIIVNFDVGDLSVDNVDVVMMRMYEKLRQGTIEGIQLALQMQKVATKNSGLAV